VAEHAPPLDPPRGFPALDPLADGTAPQPASMAHGGGRQPPEQDREHIGAGRVLLAHEPQRGQVTSGGFRAGVPRASAGHWRGQGLSHGHHHRLGAGCGGPWRTPGPGG
jgi:hypothetical protein